MHIQNMSLQDIPAVLALGSGEASFEVAAEDRFWTKEQLERWITKDEDVLLVAKDGEDVIGFVLTQRHVPTRKATLENILVAQSYRKKGIGRALLQKTLSVLKALDVTYVCLFTRVTNKDQVAYFEHNGFTNGHDFVWFGLHMKD